LVTLPGKIGRKRFAKNKNSLVYTRKSRGRCQKKGKLEGPP
jgi:hypothetical protein